MDLIELLKHATFVEYGKNERPIFEIENRREYTSFLKSRISKALDQDLEIDDSYGIVQNGNNIRFAVIPGNFQRITHCRFYLDESEFLDRYGPNPLEGRFFVHSLSFSYPDDDISKSEFFRCHAIFVDIAELIRMLSGHEDKNNLVIFYKKSLHVQKTVEQSALETLRKKCDEIQEIVDILKDEISRTEDAAIREEFLKKAIFDLFKNESNPSNKPDIGDITIAIDKIYDEYRLVKRAYIDSLDTEKIKRDFESRYRESLTALKTLLSDLHTKALFVPMAVLFALAQKYSKEMDEQNTILFYLAFLAFFAVLGYFVWGYRSILDNIKAQIDILAEESKGLPIESQTQKIRKLFNSVQRRTYAVLALILLASVAISCFYFEGIYRWVYRIFE